MLIHFIQYFQRLFKFRDIQREGKGESCVHIYPNGLWNNANCDEPRGYICSGPSSSEDD